MNKRILGGLAVAAMLAGGFATTTGVAQADTVHHPVCAAGSTLVKDQAPYSGLSVTIPSGYSGVTMYLKISTQHVEVPVVSAGETYGPDDLSSWPKNKNGQAQEISHVDYCVPTPETPEWTPPIYPPFTPEVCVEYRLEKQTSTWNGTTGTWSAWIDDDNAGPKPWGVVPDPRTGHDAGSHGANGDQHFAYVVVNERPVFSQECIEQPPTPDPDVTTKWGDCSTGDATVNGEQRTITYGYEWTREGWSKVVVSDITINVERPLDADEQEACVPPADDPSVTREDVGEPVCGTTTIKVTVTTITYTPEYIEGAWVQVASEPVVTEGVRNLTAGEQFACPTTPPDVVAQLPPPATPAAPVVVAANSPAQAPAVPAAGLPATGSNGTGMTALLALLATSLGGVALLVARRRNVTT